MKKFAFLFILFISFNLFSTTYNTPVIDGVINVAPADPDDWDADENLGEPAIPGSEPDWQMWLTWDADSLYMGWRGPVLYPSNNDEILVYIGLASGGTNIGLYNEVIGFYADFGITLRQNRANSLYYIYSRGNRDWGTGTSLVAGELEWTSATDETEMGISWFKMTNGSSSVPIPFDLIVLDNKNNEDVIALWPSTNDLEEPFDEYYHETGDSLETPGEDILPVCLSTFTVNYINNVSILQWITQTESNNLGWNIYRSISQNLAQILQINISLIPGAGTTSQPTEYTFIDESIHDYIEMNNIPPNTTFWYWLESVDYLGGTSIYGPVTLSIPDEDDVTPELPETTILYGNFPNPFNPATDIRFDIKEGEVGTLSIFNTKGQLIKKQRFLEGTYDDYSWDASQHASGVYIYNLRTDSYFKTAKMILMK